MNPYDGSAISTAIATALRELIMNNELEDHRSCDEGVMVGDLSSWNRSRFLTLLLPLKTLVNFNPEPLCILIHCS